MHGDDTQVGRFGSRQGLHAAIACHPVYPDSPLAWPGLSGRPDTFHPMTLLPVRPIATTKPLTPETASSPAVASVVPSGPGPVSWALDGTLFAVDFSAAGDEPVAPCAVFRLGDRPRDAWGAALAPDAGCVVVATQHEAMCLDADGAVRWRIPFTPPAHSSIGLANCAFSLDGSQVWIFRPDAMLGRGDGGDRWLVVDAADGRVIAEYALPTVGQGAHQVAHPDGIHMLLDVGEGQDGVFLFHGRLDGDAISVHSYPWDDRCLIDVSPDGREFMTVGHGEDDAVFHAFPDGTELCRFAVERFLTPAAADEDGSTDDNDEVEEPHIAWSGGYLDAATAVITVAGETEDDEWNIPYVVDLASGAIRGRLAAEPRLRGDGSWTTVDDHGGLTLWKLG
ncbi:hypothetical protein ACIG0C_09540 [Kitasatospora aureofaciens]|uniref:Uncharacterized protein n=3 Tax=Kitasatospora aureofaciens TaxID=1894 RepID=A0A8H9LKB7_KITAU|nr:hypothetical protein [Kitasatospora aureofaciens]GGU56207.1 hypothetical protein GCM10010502_03150 [Kitasatospora aureofaciens]